MMSLISTPNPLHQTPLQFAASKKPTQPANTAQPKTVADFTQLLKTAKPFADYLGDFRTPALRRYQNGETLILTPSIASTPAGGGASHFLFAPDGSVSKLQYPAVVSPSSRPNNSLLPPGSVPESLVDIQPILPPGSMPSALLAQQRQQVDEVATRLT